MRRVSLRRQKLHRAVAAVREAFEADFPQCMLCGRESQDTHEIPRGAHRAGALGTRAALLRLCRGCHENVQNWPITQQLALKGLRDGQFYDRREVNRLRSRAEDAIEECEVWQSLPTVLARMGVRL